MVEILLAITVFTGWGALIVCPIGLILIVLSEADTGLAPGGSDRRFLQMGGLLIGSTLATIAVMSWIYRYL